MARRAPTFICQNCGAAYGRWQGKCDACGDWNTIAEERRDRAAADARTCAAQGPRVSLEPSPAERTTPAACLRHPGIRPRDRRRLRARLGAAAGGDPGIGKSTLLIQVAAALARAGHRAVYISGEEAVAQVRLRAERLGLADAPVELGGAKPRSRTSSPRSPTGSRRGWSSSTPSRPCGPTRSNPHPARSHRCAPPRRPDPFRQAVRRGPHPGRPRHRTARSRARAWSSTWSTPCWLRGRGSPTSASCARSKTASAPPTRSACSR